MIFWLYLYNIAAGLDRFPVWIYHESWISDSSIIQPNAEHKLNVTLLEKDQEDQICFDWSKYFPNIFN